MSSKMFDNVLDFVDEAIKVVNNARDGYISKEATRRYWLYPFGDKVYTGLLTYGKLADDFTIEYLRGEN